MSRKHVPPRTLNSLLVATQSFCEALWSRSDMHVSQFPRLLFLEHLLHGLRVAPQEKLSVFADWRPFTSKNAEIPSWVWFKQIHPEAIRKQENTECSRNTTTATTQMSSCMILCSLVRLQRGEIQETGDSLNKAQPSAFLAHVRPLLLDPWHCCGHVPSLDFHTVLYEVYSNSM